MSFWLRLRGSEGSLLVAFVAVLVLLTSALIFQPGGADAARDERTLSLYEIHTKETTTVTFKRNGKYVPAALKKLNWAMRDWRTNVATKMDPKLFDLVWQLHKDVGSKKSVYVISGHRSAKTNRKLRRKGGGQAKKSQHILGHAMDIHFPDVPMSRVRKAAFQHEVGGVGYYPTSAIPFVHVDTARVRAWPRMPRTQLAMLFPYSSTKHRPSSGGPLTSRDRKAARIRIASLDRKSRNNATFQLASANIRAASKPTTARPGRPTRQIVLASLTESLLGTLKIPGLSSHTSRLWVNKAGNRALLDTDNTTRNSFAKYAQKGNGSSHAKSPARQIPWGRTAAPKARLQLASLSPQENIRIQPEPKKNLWINGVGLRASWDTDIKALRRASQERLIQPAKPQHTIASFEPVDTQSQPQQKFNAERVAYAPSFDEEHPDELSYRPFQILPLMSSKPVALNKTLVAMVEPKYDRIYEVLASSENIPMQFRPSSREAETLWNNQFKGNAIINIRKQTQNTLQPAKPQRIAQR